MKGERIMKKVYTLPDMRLIALDISDLLTSSLGKDFVDGREDGNQVADDIFDIT